MAISNINNYGTIYENIYAFQAKKEASATEDEKVSEEKTENAGQRKTAMDELTYLSNKYSNYSFVAVNYTKGMRYGSSATVNVAISPQFLAKMANSPELEAEYEQEIANMQKIDEQLIRSKAAQGRSLETGWAIDKNGGISKWGISRPDPNAKSHLRTMSENAEKIRKQGEEKRKKEKLAAERRQEKKQERLELEEKMREACKEKIGEKFRGVTILEGDKVENDRMQKESAAGAAVDLEV